VFQRPLLLGFFVVVASASPAPAERVIPVVQRVSCEWIHRLAFSNDGTILAAVCGGFVSLWTTDHGDLYATLLPPALGSSYDSVAFSPDDKLLAMTALDGTLSLWDRTSLTLRWTLRRPGKTPISGVSVWFSSDGKLLYAYYPLRSEVVCWEIASGTQKAVRPVAGSTFPARVDGSRLYGITGDGMITTLDLASGSTSQRMLSPKPEPLPDRVWPEISISPDGGLVATGADAGVVTIPLQTFPAYLWNMRTGVRSAAVVPPALARTIVWSPDGRSFIGALSSGAGIGLWDSASGKLVRTFPLETFPPHPLFALSRDGRKLAVCIRDSSPFHISLWSADSGALIWDGKDNFGGDITRVEFDRDGTHVISSTVKFGKRWTWDVETAHPSTVDTEGYQGGRLGKYRWLWDSASGRFSQPQLIGKIEPFSTDIVLARSPTGDRAVLWRVYKLILRDENKGSEKELTDGQRPGLLGAENACCAAFSSDGSLVISGSRNGVRFWDAASGELQARSKLPESDAPVVDLKLSPNGTTLGVASLGGPIRLWNLKTTAQQVIHAGEDGVKGFIFSLDGASIATWTEYTIAVWSASSGRALWSSERLDTRVVSLAMSPDGTLLASGGGSVVGLWTLKTGRRCVTMATILEDYSGIADPKEWISYTPDGFYDGSLNAAQLIRWRTNGGLFGGNEYVAAFHRSPLRPCTTPSK